MVADPFVWRSRSPYYSYLFEILFVIAGCLAFRFRTQLWRRPSGRDAIAVVLSFVGGGLALCGASWVSVPVPFDFSSTETRVLLLLVAPILEEAVFRLVLWEAFATVFRKPLWVLLATTALFSLGHAAAYNFVPEIYRGFVLYQVLYVTLLGLAAGFRRRDEGCWNSAVFVHFGFNLGFFFASSFTAIEPT